MKSRLKYELRYDIFNLDKFKGNTILCGVWDGKGDCHPSTIKLAGQSLFQVYLPSPRYICILFSPCFLRQMRLPKQGQPITNLLFKTLLQAQCVRFQEIVIPLPQKVLFFQEPPFPTPLNIPFHWSYPSTHNFPNYNISFGTTRKEHLLLSFLTKLMIAFVRRHPILVFLWHKGRNF